MNCLHCTEPLSKSIYNSNETMKSCLSCSQKNGKHHVFHPYPSAFGTTKKRASTKNPSGPQSHCTVCRGNKTPSNQGNTCDVVK